MKKFLHKGAVIIKKIFLGFLCVLILGTTCACSPNTNSLKVLDSGGEIFATIKSDHSLTKHENHAYLQIAVNEAADIIANLNQIEKEAAKKLLYKKKYTIYTAFDKEINTSLSTTCTEKYNGLDIGAAITDLNANLVAAYSTTKSKKGENLANKSSPPCSSLKPLSVYAPALDNGTINWSSRYEDSPYKYVKNLEGVMSPWPNNANNVYTERYAYIHQAIMESINTVAVKCLKDYGIDNSIGFLEENFEIPLAPEKTISAAKGSEEVLANIALGYLTNGVSTVDMAGYYQIFANEGKYKAPKTILKICDGEGAEIYKRQSSVNQVIKPTTAQIMNRMLKDVVSPNGTGKSAACDLVEVAGKTGTDDTGQNNWFVGITPEYSCAFWHGYNDKNIAAEIFGNAIKNIYSAKTNYKKSFTYSSGVKQVAYCTESGKQFKAGCSLIRMGYFTQDNLPRSCDRH